MCLATQINTILTGILSEKQMVRRSGKTSSKSGSPSMAGHQTRSRRQEMRLSEVDPIRLVMNDLFNGKNNVNNKRYALDTTAVVATALVVSRRKARLTSLPVNQLSRVESYLQCQSGSRIRYLSIAYLSRFVTEKLADACVSLNSTIYFTYGREPGFGPYLYLHDPPDHCKW